MIGAVLALVLAAGGAPTEGFLERNAKVPGVRTLKSGVQYRVVTRGPRKGAGPVAGDLMTLHYEGKLLTGQVFDSSFERGEAAELPLDRLIPCWIEAMPLMRPGDEWVLFCPANTAYGARAVGPIPANSVLSFRIKLIGVTPKPR